MNVRRNHIPEKVNQLAKAGGVMKMNDMMDMNSEAAERTLDSEMGKLSKEPAEEQGEAD